MRKEANLRSPIDPPPTRIPGQALDDRLKDMAFGRGVPLLLIWMFATGLVFGSAAQALLGRYLPIPLIAVSLSLVSAVAAWIGITRHARAAKTIRLGRDGERHVAQLLQSLDLPGARVFHDIPAGRFNLDHVVVCDKGVFVVETKTRRKPSGNTALEARNGRLLLRGRPVFGNAIGQVAGAAKWLEDLLLAEADIRMRCQPVVVLPGWFIKPADAQTRATAWVLEPKALVKWIRGASVRLGEPEIRRIEAAILRYLRSQVVTAD